MKVLIGYDGSVESRTAIREAARLFSADTATVVTVWDDFPVVTARASAELPSSLDFEGIDRECRERAWRSAEEGTSHARAAGLAASALAVPRRTSIADALLAQADALGADVIVLGSRGVASVRSIVMGSTARAVLRRSGRPVLIVPAPRSPDADRSRTTPTAQRSGIR